jgi:hypothetical protein
VDDEIASPDKLHAAEIIRNARATLGRLDQRDREQRCLRIRAYKSLNALRIMFDAVGARLQSMSADDQLRWRARRRELESQLTRIAERGFEA